MSNIYGDHASSNSICKEWLQRSRSGNFQVSDKEDEEAPKKFEDTQLQELLDEGVCRTLHDLSKKLDNDRSTVNNRLHAMEMIQKSGNWGSHQLKEGDIERRLVAYEMLLEEHKRKGFLHGIVTSDEK